MREKLVKRLLMQSLCCIRGVKGRKIILGLVASIHVVLMSLG